MKENKKNEKTYMKVQQLFNFLDAEADDVYSAPMDDIQQDLKDAQINVADFKQRLAKRIQSELPRNEQADRDRSLQERPKWAEQWRFWSKSFFRPSWQMSLTSILGFLVLAIVIFVHKPLPVDQPVYRGPDDVIQNGASQVRVDRDDPALLNQEIQALFARQEYSQAVPLAERVLALKTKSYGEDHLDVASAMNNLAVLYKKTGALDKAESLYLRSLSIELQWLGETHHQTLASFQHLAQLYEQQGEVQQALIYYRKILNVRMATFGPDHADVRSVQDKIQALTKSLPQDKAQ